LRVAGDPTAALDSLRARGVAGDDAFTVGSTLIVPLHERRAGEAIADINDLGVAGAIGTRQPTLDDVYLRLTGGYISEAA
jgi:hypothetical protein